MRAWARGASAVTLLAAAMLGACDNGPNRPPPLHQYTLSYDFTISPDEAPPHARDDIHYSVRIFDRKTRQPIENGEGQLFSSNAEGAKTWDGMVYGPEVGTYHAKLNFVVPGLWAVAIRFRRDSIHPLERTDWMQDVINERPSNIP
ncbi:MAG TPA: hypothetical protein VL524_18100 [Gemmatimonadaceae bacterium]|jgi:hypothetical protein|nr:hypothetical protein [Gemmatimonadaceae bacterium]